MMKWTLVAGLLASALCMPGTASAASKVNGGAITNVFTITSEVPATATTAFKLLPGASHTMNVPPAGATVIVNFTAECSLSGNTAPKMNWVEVEIRDDDTPMSPTGDGGDPVAFCSADGYSAHAISAVKRLSAGTHKIRVFFKVFKGNADVVTGSLDDWALTILVAK